MGARTNSLHEQVMENTKRLALRAQQMLISLEKVQLDKKVGLFMEEFCFRYFKFLLFLFISGQRRLHESVDIKFEATFL